VPIPVHLNKLTDLGSKIHHMGCVVLLWRWGTDTKMRLISRGLCGSSLNMQHKISCIIEWNQKQGEVGVVVLPLIRSFVLPKPVKDPNRPV